MGVVFSAFDPELGRRVALKISLADHDEARMRFTLEARALAQVDHPNVIKLLEVGRIRDVPYMAMPLLEGRSLLDACADSPLREKVAILKSVAEGVHAAHLKGLLHRDIKPTNIMVVPTAEGDLHA
jgi:serine/threonine protein kinase